MSQTAGPTTSSATLAHLGIHDHPCLFYAVADEAIYAAAAFTKIGLERGERCICALPDRWHLPLTDALHDFGCDVEQLIRQETLALMTSEAFYRLDQPFDTAARVDSYRAAVQAALAVGYPGLRLVGDVAALYEAVPVPVVLDYERAVSRFLGEAPASALCLHPRRRALGGSVPGVLATHAQVLVGDVVCPSPLAGDAADRGHDDPVASDATILAALRTEAAARGALQRVERQAQRIMESMAEGVCIADDAGVIIEVNPAAERIFGRPRAELLGGKLEQLCQRTCQEASHMAHSGCPVAQAFARQRPCHQDTLRWTRPDGSVRWVRVSAAPLVEQPPARNGVVVNLQDVTEQHLAEERLRCEERHYRLLADQLADMISRHDLDGDYRSVSSAATRLLGWTADELVGRSAFDFVHPDDIASVRESHQRVLRDHVGSTDEFRLRCKDGAYLWVETRTYVVLDEPGGAESTLHEIVCVTRDISARKAAEARAQQRQQELIHAARLSLIGEMASGVAHELNQPLSAICSYADVLQEALRVGDFEQARQTGEWVSQQARRAALIVSRVQGFARKQRAHRSTVDVAELLRETVQLIESDVQTRGIMLRVTIAEDVPPVFADRIQIQQVLLNLMRNGIDAMQDIAAPRHTLTLRAASATERVMLSVEDQGVGISAVNLSRLFEPFFTTKPNGLGLGLSVSRSIVEDHGGKLSARPNDDFGMTFTVELASATASETA